MLVKILVTSVQVHGIRAASLLKAWMPIFLAVGKAGNSKSNGYDPLLDIDLNLISQLFKEAEVELLLYISQIMMPRHLLAIAAVIMLLAGIQGVAGLRETVPAVRVVRFQVDYPNASLVSIGKIPKWNSMMRNSVLASLRFINKHWLICGGSESEK